MRMIFDTLFAMLKKEFRQLRRDRRMVFVLFFFPLFLLFVFGYAINLDVRHIKLGVLDFEKSSLTRKIVASISSTEYFDLVSMYGSYIDAQSALDHGDVQMVIVFPRDFSKQVVRKEEPKVQILIDGVNGNTASIIYNYAQVLVANFFSNPDIKRFTTSPQFPSLMTFRIEPLFWFNPSLKSSLFLVPGLIGIIIILSAAISVSLSIVKEKENNTIEQIYVSPISIPTFLFGKILPFSAIAFINSLLVLFLGFILFEVPIRGNLLELVLAIILYIFSALSIGIFVSAVAETQLFAFLFVVVISVLPSMLLSGFIFPIESMPPFIQLLTNITPAKFFLSIIRGILLRGNGIKYFWDDLLYLFVYGSIFILLAFVVEKVKRKRQ